MKLFLMLLGMAAAGVLGYLAEPSLRASLVGAPAPAPKQDTGEAETPEVARTPDIDPATLAPEQLPATVKIKREAKLKDLTPGATMLIDAGTELKLVKVSGKNAILRPAEDSPYTFPFPIIETDLLEQLAANPPKPVVAVEETTPEPAPAEETEPESAPVVEETPPEPEPSPEPAPMPGGESAEPEPMPEPPVADNQPEPAPMPEPAPESEPAAEPAAQPAGDDVVAIMKKSIADGDVKEFTLDQVTEWQPGGVETIDGSSYQTGTLTYKAETIFGVRTIQAKALIHNGEVLRWIWPKSGMEIR